MWNFVMSTGHLVFSEISRNVRWVVSVQDGSDEEYIHKFRRNLLENGHLRPKHRWENNTTMDLKKYSVRKWLRVASNWQI